jgi:hypothetical protein
MSETPIETAAETSGDSAEAPAPEATPTAPEVRDPAALLSAYEAEKGKRKEADKASRDLQAKIDALQAKVDGKEAEHAERQRLQAEVDARYNEKIRKAEVRAAAAGRLSDPADALRFLDMSEIEVNSDGEVDSTAVAAAIDDLIAKKPYLAAQGGSRFKGTADGGARNDASRPSQLTKADMARMSPEEIDAAHNEGRFTSLLGPQ